MFQMQGDPSFLYGFRDIMWHRFMRDRHRLGILDPLVPSGGRLAVPVPIRECLKLGLDRAECGIPHGIPVGTQDPLEIADRIGPRRDLVQTFPDLDGDGRERALDSFECMHLVLQLKPNEHWAGLEVGNRFVHFTQECQSGSF